MMVIPKVRRVGRWTNPKESGTIEVNSIRHLDGNEIDSNSRRGDPELNFN